MNEITKWTCGEFQIRTLTIEDEPYFASIDVTVVLGYSNPRDALAKHTDEEDKATVAIHDGSRNRNMTAINESELYSLIFSSNNCRSINISTCYAISCEDS